MSLDETIYCAMKAAAWERAKGELRALVMIKGAVSSDGVPFGAPFPYEALQARVEDFIRGIEDDGLHE